MTRTRASAKAAGTRHESAVVAFLATHLEDDRIERRARTGAKDRGDIAGVKHMGQRICIEAKDCVRLEIGMWLHEVEHERIHDDAGVGLVVAKRRGHGDVGDAVVFCTLRDLVSLIRGSRPEPTP